MIGSSDGRRKDASTITVGATPAQVVTPLMIALFPGLAVGFGLSLLFDLDSDNEGFAVAVGVVVGLTAVLFRMCRIRFDDTGILVRRPPWGARQVAWHDVRAFAFVREAGGVDGVPGYELVLEFVTPPRPHPGETRRRFRWRTAGRSDLVLLTTQSISAGRRPPATLVGRYAERQLATALAALDDRGVRHRNDLGGLEPAGESAFVRMLWERAGRGAR